ncbi:MAG: hypothetical protein ACRCY5_05035 [Phocaeicola sp.]
MDLNALGVEAMSKQEMRTTDGGFWTAILVGALVGLVVAELNDRDNSDFEEGRLAAKEFWS